MIESNKNWPIEQNKGSIMKTTIERGSIRNPSQQAITAGNWQSHQANTATIKL
jgi:hypothetical protein